PRAAPAPAFLVASAARSYLEQLLLLHLQHRVDLGDDVVGALLELLLDAVEVVLADLAVLLELLELVARLAADVAAGHAAFLGAIAHDLHEVAPPFLGELRERETDDLTVVRRVD